MVRDWFYPQHAPRSSFEFVLSPVDRRQDAINLVSLWKFRDPSLTHALVSTAHLTDAILHDQPGTRGAVSCMALRSIYAMSFCRFVNALVDRDVRKSVTASITKNQIALEPDAGSGPTRGQSTMYAHALALGLPETFVELRHQAIHEEMPSLEMLRMRTGEALEWLWERWWKVNAKGSPEPASTRWEEKHRRWQTDRGGHVAAEEKEVGSSGSSLCRQCRKRKWASKGEEDGDESDCEAEAGDDSDNVGPLKQQKPETDQANPIVPTRRQQGWVMAFSPGTL